MDQVKKVQRSMASSEEIVAEIISEDNSQLNWMTKLFEHANSYAFASGWRCKAVTKTEFVPGFLKGNPLRRHASLKNPNTVAKFVKSDFRMSKRKVYETIFDIPEHLPEAEEGTYWIKALCCMETEVPILHFMRKDNKTGLWLHKADWKLCPDVVKRIVAYTDEKELLLKSGIYSSDSPEEVERAINILFPEGTPRKIIPTQLALELDDNSGCQLIGEFGSFTKYTPLFAMRVEA